MGGNIAMLYAGIRPDRVGRLLSMEALGLPPSEPHDAANKYRQWLTEILSEEPAKIYPNANLLKHSIYKGNPQLPDHIIEDLAELWGKTVDEQGAMMLKGDHRHRYTNPVRYNYQDSLEIWRSVTASTGLIMATDSMMYKRFGSFGRIDEVKEVFRIAPHHYYEIAECGHMLHLEKPYPFYSYEEHSVYVCQRGERPPVSPNKYVCPRSIKRLLQQSWCPSVQQRYSIHTVCHRLQKIQAAL